MEERAKLEKGKGDVDIERGKEGGRDINNSETNRPFGCEGDLHGITFLQSTCYPKLFVWLMIKQLSSDKTNRVLVGCYIVTVHHCLVEPT